jgi:hypothetical protein
MSSRKPKLSRGKSEFAGVPRLPSTTSLDSYPAGARDTRRADAQHERPVAEAGTDAARDMRPTLSIDLASLVADERLQLVRMRANRPHRRDRV